MGVILTCRQVAAMIQKPGHGAGSRPALWLAFLLAVRPGEVSGAYGPGGEETRTSAGRPSIHGWEVARTLWGVKAEVVCTCV